MTDLGQIPWIVARAGGFLAYGLLTASVVLGLVLGLGWKSRVFTRFVTTETHRFITLVGLVFIGIHGVALLLDPFIGFTPVEVLVPFVSHYRPLFVALGVVGGYLAVAVWASEYLRSRIGYAWWRRFHVVAFAVWALATVHGIGNGTDTKAPWALAIYGVSTVLVVGLLALRLRPRLAASGRALEGGRALVRPAVAAIALVGVLAVVAWTWAGPLQPGWNAVANNGNGSGRATAAAPAPAAAAIARQAPSPLAAQPFQTDIAATVQQNADGSQLLIDGALAGGPGGRFQLLVPSQVGDTPAGTFRFRTDAGTTCTGKVTSIQRGQVLAGCTDDAGGTWVVGLRLQLARDGSVVGIIAAKPGSATTL
jgi:hypothetical protein